MEPHWLIAVTLITTASSSGTAAATAYAERKRQFEDTEVKCNDNGIILKPVILTAQGGADPCAQKTIEVIHRAVASETGIKLEKVRDDFAIRLSVAIVRANARATRRRDPDGPIAASRQRARHSEWARSGLTSATILQGPPEPDNDETEDMDVDGAAADVGILQVGSRLEADAPMPQFQ